MQELRGMPVVNAMAETLKNQIADLKDKGVTPTLAIIRVGARPDDLAYERGAIKRFTNVEAGVRVVELPEDCTQEVLENTLTDLNNDDSVHGILLFRPLPKHLNEEPLKQMIRVDKDVDCMSPKGYASVFMGDKTGFPPCTPQAVVELLDHNKIDLSGKKVVIVGRSLVVGKPLAILLLAKHATVTICHTRTKNLEEECLRADILVACAGVAKMIKAGHVRPGQIVVDVGINMDGDKLCGDVDYDEVAPVVEAITPVPGGVGTITTSVLLKHTIQNAIRMQG